MKKAGELWCEIGVAQDRWRAYGAAGTCVTDPTMSAPPSNNSRESLNRLSLFGFGLSPSKALASVRGPRSIEACPFASASPGSAGFDASRIEALTRDVSARRFGTIHGVVVVRYGHLVVEHYDDRKRALTLRHLVTMRTSMDFWEQPYAGSPLDQLNRSSDDWTKFILDRPMTGAPGTSSTSRASAISCFAAVDGEVGR
jgi:hypothetical protein